MSTTLRAPAYSPTATQGPPERLRDGGPVDGGGAIVGGVMVNRRQRSARLPERWRSATYIMAENIRALRFDAGCDVIADDVLFFDEDPFQDGPIAQAVSAVIADGALYFSSAGNEGNTLDGTSGNYEGDFVDSRRGVGKVVGAAHDFDPGAGVQVFEPIFDASSAGVPVTRFWADPLGAAADDYDVYLFDADDNLIAFSQNVQNGNDDPFELLFTPFFGGEGLRLAVVKFSGATRYFQLSALPERAAPVALTGQLAIAGRSSVCSAWVGSGERLGMITAIPGRRVVGRGAGSVRGWCWAGWCGRARVP
jgi:hypothetical protein